MPAITISIPQMVDLALATPTLGGMNLGVLHSLMQIIVQKLGLTGCRVEFHGEQSDVFETLVSRIPKKPLVKVDEFELDSTDIMKRHPVPKEPEPTRHLFTINQQEGTEGFVKEIPPGFPLQPIHLFVNEELAQQSVHDRIAPVLPKPEDLLHEPGGDENAIFDMFKMINLEKRLEAIEEALKNLGQTTIVKTKETHDTSEVVDTSKNLISELLERMNLFEQVLAGMSSTAGRPSLESDYSKRKSNASRASSKSRGASLRASGATAIMSYDGSAFAADQSKRMTNNTAEGFLANAEQLEQYLKDRLKSLLCNELTLDDCQMLDELKNAVANQLRGELFDALSTYITNVKNTKEERHEATEIHQPDGISEYRKKWFRNCPRLDENENSQYNVSNRIGSYDEMVRRMLSDDLFLNLLGKQLNIQCHCPHDVVKANEFYDVSSRLVDIERDLEEFHSNADEGSWPHFKEMLIKLKDEIPEINNELNQFRVDFLKTMREVQDILDSKVDKCHVPAIKHFVVSHIEEINSKLEVLMNKKPIPEATIGSYSMVTDLKCVSCNTEVCMKDRLFPANVPKYPKAPQSKVIQSSEPEPVGRSCYNPPSTRFCGGRYTVTRPEDRLWRSGQFFDQFKVLPPSQDVVLAEGTSGRMFRVDPPKPECVCVEPVVEERNRCNTE